jgi:6-phosphogluconolactonase/glucosamine-6-phosphate isomerase/deaminase
MTVLPAEGGPGPAAALVYETVREAAVLVPGGSPLIIAVPGGSSPIPFFAFWRSRALEGRSFPHEHLVIIEADERMVPSDHPDSNARLIREHLTVGVPGLERAFRPFPPDQDPAGFIADLPFPSVSILGLGEDGHVASLFPCCPEDWERRERAFISRSPDHPHPRISLSFSYLNGSGRIILLAFGEKKRRALNRFYKRDPSMPAAHLETEKLVLITDIP